MGSEMCIRDSAFASALQLLTTNVDSDDLADVASTTRALVDADAIESHDFRELERQLTRDEAEDAPAEAIDPVEPVEEQSEEPKDLRGGFGSRRYGPVTLAVLLSLAVGAVIIIAALTAYLVGFLSGDDTNAPVTVDSVQTGVEEVEEEVTGLPVLLTPMRATIEGASAPELVDADRSTTWTGSDNVSVELRPAKGATARKGFTLELSLIHISGAHETLS